MTTEKQWRVLQLPERDICLISEDEAPPGRTWIHIATTPTMTRQQAESWARAYIALGQVAQDGGSKTPPVDAVQPKMSGDDKLTMSVLRQNNAHLRDRLAAHLKQEEDVARYVATLNDKIQMLEGKIAERDEPRKVWACVIVRNEQGHVLLRKRGPGFDEGKYGPPGGKCLPNELSEACAARELAEEAGLKAERYERLFVHEEPRGVSFVYGVKPGAWQPEDLEDGHGPWEWVAPAEIEALGKDGVQGGVLFWLSALNDDKQVATLAAAIAGDCGTVPDSVHHEIAKRTVHRALPFDTHTLCGRPRSAMVADQPVDIASKWARAGFSDSVRALLKQAARDTDPISMFTSGDYPDGGEDVAVVVIKGQAAIRMFRDWAQRVQALTPGKGVADEEP